MSTVVAARYLCNKMRIYVMCAYLCAFRFMVVGCWRKGAKSFASTSPASSALVDYSDETRGHGRSSRCSEIESTGM
jgi:hypothetical protein